MCIAYTDELYNKINPLSLFVGTVRILQSFKIGRNYEHAQRNVSMCIEFLATATEGVVCGVYKVVTRLSFGVVLT